jgi:hypothetical protein
MENLNYDPQNEAGSNGDFVGALVAGSRDAAKLAVESEAVVC